MTRPPQSMVMRSTMSCPKVVEPLGFGAATTQPCAAHNDGFQRVDHASPQTPCGPPWMRKTIGYLRDESKFGGFSSQYWTLPPAAVTDRLSGSMKATSFSHSSLARVSCLTSLPVAAAR